MAILGPVLIAAAWSGACVWLAWSFPRAVRDLTGEDLGDELRRVVEEAVDDRDRVIGVNHALDDLEHRLTNRSRLPRQAAWLNVVGVALVLVGGALASPGWALLGCLPVAMIGVGACLAASRRGVRAAERERERLDRLVEEVVGPLYDVEVVLPAVSAARQRRRRRRG